jgi:hypothetical protein
VSGFRIPSNRDLLYLLGFLSDNLLLFLHVKKIKRKETKKIEVYGTGVEGIPEMQMWLFTLSPLWWS